MIDPIVPASWLAARLDPVPASAAQHDGRPLVVVDSRWYLDGRSGLDAYRRGHLPGAVWVDLERWLAAPAQPGHGRHPLPDPATFAEGMSRHGIGDGTVVVVYDDQAGLVAGRLVWMLRRTGHDAALLDGGLAAWPGPLEHGEPVPPAGSAGAPSSFTPRPWPPEHFVGTADVRDRAPGTVVLDARAAERYRGEVEPIDPQAGHIPGARSMPLTGNLTEAGTFLAVEALTERYAGLGDGDVIAYCGSGVSACHDLLALEATGRLGRLYVGSWSAWSSTPGLPIATGDE